jgi:glutamyl-tRNA synthetase
LNFVVRLGWSHGNEEIISRNQMIEWFDFEHVGSTSGVWNPEKLLWLNHHYIKTEAPPQLLPPFLEQLQARGFAAEAGPRLLGIIRAQQERAHTLAEMVELSRYFFAEPQLDPKAKEKFLTPASRDALGAIREGLAVLNRFEPADIELLFKATSERLMLGLGKVAQPVRVALTGGTVSPPIQDLVALLGRETSLNRLDRTIAAI